jgi:hypothetical protein
MLESPSGADDLLTLSPVWWSYEHISMKGQSKIRRKNHRMMHVHKILKRFLSLSFFICASMPAFPIEKELLGVKLGADYREAIAFLTEKYGPPVKSERTTQHYDVFLFGEERANNIIIGNHKNIESSVAWIQASGDKPIENLKFLGDLNVGHKEKAIKLLMPKPTKIIPSSDDSRTYLFEYSNYSVKVKKGTVSSIRIDLSNALLKKHEEENKVRVFSRNEAFFFKDRNDPDAYLKDSLRDHCKLRYPIINRNNAYLIDVNVFSSGSNEPHTFTFLLDTGWSDHAISTKVCEAIGCKDMGEDREDPQSRIVTGGVLAIGNALFKVDPFRMRDFDLYKEIGVDGIIGGRILLSRSMLLNQKNEYICFIDGSLPDLAKSIGFLALPAQYDAGRIWLDFEANGQTIKDYFMDTGTDTTSLLLQDIQRLGLQKISSKTHLMAEGPATSQTYGPVEIGWKHIKRKIDFVYETTPEFRKIGNDFLGGLIIGIDPSGDRIFISD